MNSSFYYPLNSGSLGETRRTRRAIYSLERRPSIQFEEVHKNADEPDSAMVMHLPRNSSADHATVYRVLITLIRDLLGRDLSSSEFRPDFDAELSGDPVVVKRFRDESSLQVSKGQVHSRR